MPVTHTPGPWTIELLGENASDHDVEVWSKDAPVAFVLEPDRSANARLIASSPVLLTALTLVLQEMNDGFLICDPKRCAADLSKFVNLLNTVTLAIFRATEGK